MSKTTHGQLLQKVVTMAAALAAARAMLHEIRMDEWCGYTLIPHKDTPEAWAMMDPGERAAIRRYDRLLAKIDKALR